MIDVLPFFTLLKEEKCFGCHSPLQKLPMSCPCDIRDALPNVSTDNKNLTEVLTLPHFIQDQTKAPFTWGGIHFTQQGICSLLIRAKQAGDRSMSAQFMQSGHGHSPLYSMGGQV